MTMLTDIPGVGPALAKKLESAGISTVDAVASVSPDHLANIRGVSAATAPRIIADAKKVGALPSAEPSQQDDPPTRSSAEQPAPTEPRPNDVARLERKVEKLEAKIAKLKKALKKAKKTQAKPPKARKKSKKRKKK